MIKDCRKKGHEKKRMLKIKGNQIKTKRIEIVDLAFKR